MDSNNLGDKFKGVDVLLIGGLPASGKTTLATTLFKDRYRINRDSLRSALHQMTTGQPFTSDDFNYNGEGLITEVEFEIYNHALVTGRRIVMDNTFISTRRRQEYIWQAKDRHRTIGCIFLVTPFQVCLQRNKERTKDQVPRKILEDQYAALQIPSLSEGFTQLEVVGV